MFLTTQFFKAFHNTISYKFLSRLHLQWRELMRTKNMILTRFMPIEEADSEILQYPLFQLYQYCDVLERRAKKVRLLYTT